MAVGKQIGDLPVANSVANSSVVLVESNPGSNSAVTYQVALSNVAINKLAEKSTPANSAVSASQGNIRFDDNYLYITTANGVTKRVALSAF